MRSFLTPAFNVIAKMSLSSVLPLLALTGAFPPRIPAQDNIMVTPSPPAALALERFVAEQAAHSGTPVETVEIEASLPKLNKNGRLRAIRRTLSAHQLEYQVLELSGDSMVNHQLIARYLSADKRAAELNTASTAITPANYKFRYLVGHFRSSLTYFWGKDQRGAASWSRSWARSRRVNFHSNGRAVVSQ